MGNNCSVCGIQVERGKYCYSCYRQKYPTCGVCGEALLSNQEIVGSYHKFPCYSQTFMKCCKCDCPLDSSVNGAFCRICYDSMCPPPLRFEMTYNGCEVKLYLREDEFNSTMQPLAYAFGRGLSDGGNNGHFLMDR